MAKQDYYKLLDVARTATDADIKKAYRRLAMKYHPDRNPDDPESEHKFKEAKEAYEILCDPQKRAVYDQFGHAGLEGGRGGGFSAGEAFGDIFGEMFGDIFSGGQRGRSQVFRGADLRYELELDLEQSAAGAGGGSDTGGASGHTEKPKDDVLDAEFEEVKESDRKKA